MKNSPILLAQPVTRENFARFGRVYSLVNDRDTQIIWGQGEGWYDGFTRMPLIEGKAHLGMTRVKSCPWYVKSMERHLKTEEAIFCATEAIVLAVAPASCRDRPCHDEMEAFVITLGQVVILKRGVWHDACRGACGATFYYWMAVCGLEENPWIDVAGPPRLVQVTQA